MKNEKTKIIVSFVVLFAIFFTMNFAKAEEKSLEDGSKIFKGQRFENRLEAKDCDKCANCEKNEEGDCQCLKMINPENFSKIREMHEFKRSGDMESAKKIAEELGLENINFEKRAGSNKKMQFKKDCPNYVNKSVN
jgi:hypothetical protein